MINTAVSCRDLSAGYGKKAVIKNISLDVRGGEILTLIGPNGAGKSTLLKAIAGYLERLDGSVKIGQMENADARELAKLLSVTLTDRVRPELMTCREVIELGRYPYSGMFGRLSDSDIAAVESAIDDTKTREISDCFFSKVSDGQRQLVMLAKAVCQQPQVLILDEPTSYLDIKHKIDFFEVLRPLVRQRQTAVIISMHELELARTVSDMIVCIKDGSVADTGTPDEIFDPDKIMRLYDIPKELYDKYIG